MSSAVSIFFPSFSSGLTLLIHVIVLKYQRVKLYHVAQHSSENDDHETTKYTAYMLGSMNYRSHFSVPPESERDEIFLSNKEHDLI